MDSLNRQPISEAIAKGDEIEIKLYNGLKITLDLKNKSHRAMFEEFINRFPRERCAFAQAISVMLPLYTYISLEKGASGSLWKDLTGTNHLEKLESERALEDAARETIVSIAKSDLGQQLATIYNNNIYDESSQDGDPYMQPGMKGADCWVAIDWKNMKKELKNKFGIIVSRPIPNRKVPVTEGFYRIVSAVNVALLDKFLSLELTEGKECVSAEEVSVLVTNINLQFGLDVKPWQIMNSTLPTINATVLRDKILKDVGEVMLTNKVFSGKSN